MNIDLIGRILNTRLPVRHGLMPLFEAIVNSIAAIEECGRSDGQVIIRIHREGQRQLAFDPHVNVITEVDSFEIEDNGAGFTDANFQSFETTDSRHKAIRGGKGIGRILWLKAFDCAEIHSTYLEDGNWRRRSFTFRASTAGIEEHTVRKISDSEIPAASPKTIVRLVAFKSQYRDSAPKMAEAIGRRIVEHCMEYFLLNTAPQMFVHDNESGDRIDLHSLFNDEYRPESGSRSISVGNVDLSITDVLLRATGDAQHRVHLCAHNRVVQSLSLNGRIPHLDRTLTNQDGDSVVYVGYVRGDFLNERVDVERTSFNIDRAGELGFAGGPVWEDITNATVHAIATYLEPRTTAVREQALARIREFVEVREPRYRPLLAHRRDQIERIPGTLSDANLDLELHKVLNNWREDVRSQAYAIQQAEETGTFAEQGAAFRRVLGELQEVAKADLADYVVHRATVLSFFEKLLGRQDNGRYADEGALHELIFPKRKTSDQVDYDDHSLWILDERLAYHRYLASDVPFVQQSGPIEVESEDRPDILIYSTPIAFAPSAEPFPSIVIVEFKRPERNDYNDSKSPIRQVFGYVRQIREGKGRRPDGSSIEVPPGTPFYCYVVATLTSRLHTEAAEFSFTRAPDGLGYFGYNLPYNAYIEVSSYRKVLEDAKKRNRAFFERLQIRIP